MPRARKSAAMLDLAGTLRRDRHAKRDRAPDGGASLSPHDAPRHLSPAVAVIWREVVEVMPPGLAGAADAALIETLCHALHSHREAARIIALEGVLGRGSEGQPVPHPALRVQTAAAPIILKACADLGMTPQARLRLSDAMPDKPAEPDPADPWAAFDAVGREIAAKRKRADA